MPIFEIIGGEIIEIALYLILAWPGILLRFLLSRFWLSKKTIQDYKKDGPLYNGLVGLLFFILLGLIIYNFEW